MSYLGSSSYGAYSSVPETPRRRRKAKRPVSMPPSMDAPSYTPGEHTAWVSSQYLRGLAVGPSFQQKAYDAVRKAYFVPQTTPPVKSRSNYGNLIPPPSYFLSMSRIGESTGLRKQDPYYLASRDYLSRTGSYYGTYSRPKYYSRPKPKFVDTYDPVPHSDVYSPSYGYGYGGAAKHYRAPLAQYNTPVIVQSEDRLEKAEPLTKIHRARSNSECPPVRAVTLGKTQVSHDHKGHVSDIEKIAEDIKSVVSPPVRAVKMGGTESDVNHDTAIDLQQRVKSADEVVSPPVRAVKRGQAEATTEQAVPVDDFEQFGELAVDLDIGAPVRAVTFGQEHVAEYANDLDALKPLDGLKTHSASVVDGAEFVVAQEHEA